MATPAPDPSNDLDAVLQGVTYPDESESAAFDALRREKKLAAARETVEEIKALVRGTRDRKGRIRQAKFTAAVLALRFEGFKEHAEIAQILGCSIHQVAGALLRVRKDADIEKQLDRIDQIVVPLAVDNVIEGVARGDKGYTLRVLDGRGIFRVHKSIDAQVKKTIITMRVNVTVPSHLPPGAPLPTIKLGSVVGASELSAGNAPPLPAALPDELKQPVEVQTAAGQTIAVLGTPAV